MSRKPIGKGPGPPPSRQISGQIRPTGPPPQKRGDPSFNRGQPQPSYQNRQGQVINRGGQPGIDNRRPPPPSQSLEQSDRAPPPAGSNQRSPNIANQRHPSGNRVPPPQQIQQKEDFQSFQDQNQGNYRGNNRPQSQFNRDQPRPGAPSGQSRPPQQQPVGPQSQQDSQLSPKNDQTDISAIMDDILAPPLQHQKSTPTPPKHQMQRTSSQNQQPVNKGPPQQQRGPIMSNLSMQNHAARSDQPTHDLMNNVFDQKGMDLLDISLYG